MGCAVGGVGRGTDVTSAEVQLSHLGRKRVVVHGGEVRRERGQGDQLGRHPLPVRDVVVLDRQGHHLHC